MSNKNQTGNDLQEQADPSDEPKGGSAVENVSPDTITIKKKRLYDALRFYSQYLLHCSSQHPITLKLIQYTAAVCADRCQSSSPHRSFVWWQRLLSSRDGGTILRNLATKLSEALYVYRFLGWPAALHAWYTNSWAISAATLPAVPRCGRDASSGLTRWIPRDLATWHAGLGRILAGSMCVYYPTEFLAFWNWYLTPEPSNPVVARRAARYSSYSCRAWSVYLVAEFFQCFLQWRSLQQKRQEYDEAVGDASRDLPQEQSLKLRMLRDVLQLVPCVHWSLPNWDIQPLLPTATVNLFMWIDAVLHQYESYRAFRRAQEA
jgi:hypothetical protein